MNDGNAVRTVRTRQVFILVKVPVLVRRRRNRVCASACGLNHGDFSGIFGLAFHSNQNWV
jgi:hypothetical protein